MYTGEDAEAAVQALNGMMFEGKSLTIAHVGVTRRKDLAHYLRRDVAVPELPRPVDTTASRLTLVVLVEVATLTKTGHTSLDRTTRDTPTAVLLVVSAPAVPSKT